MKLRRFITLFIVGVLVGSALWLYLQETSQTSRDQAATVPAASVNIPSDLEVGDRGSDVVEIQKALKAQGFAVEVTGIYDAQTAEAVAGFQANQGLFVDGVVGPATFNALMPLLDEQIANLPIGQVYYKVPNQMRVGEAEIIDIGIALQATEQMKAALQGDGEVVVRPGVHFNPLAVDMQLNITNQDDFKVAKKGDKQLIPLNQTGRWTWTIQPLKDGAQTIEIEILSDLPPSSEFSQATPNDLPPYRESVFSHAISVEANWSYSLSESLRNNWLDALNFAIGSGVIVTGTGWIIERVRKPLVIILFHSVWRIVMRFRRL